VQTWQKWWDPFPPCLECPGWQNAPQVRLAETPACQTGPEKGQTAFAAAASAATES